ncbi:MAG: Plug domain-containing protein, partial [Cyanobacteria bacterium P01_D01_bin.1]
MSIIFVRRLLTVLLLVATLPLWSLSAWASRPLQSPFRPLSNPPSKALTPPIAPPLSGNDSAAHVAQQTDEGLTDEALEDEVLELEDEVLEIDPNSPNGPDRLRLNVTGEILDRPVYTPFRREGTVRESSQPVYVIDRDQIEAQGARTVDEALQYLPGVLSDGTAG